VVVVGWLVVGEWLVVVFLLWCIELYEVFDVFVGVWLLVCLDGEEL